jgi:hypothetical protein
MARTLPHGCETEQSLAALLAALHPKPHLVI